MMASAPSSRSILAALVRRQLRRRRLARYRCCGWRCFRRALLACDDMHEVKPDRVRPRGSREDRHRSARGFVTGGRRAAGRIHVEVKTASACSSWARAEEDGPCCPGARGLWPWGAGRIGRQPGETALYLPRMSYLRPAPCAKFSRTPRPLRRRDRGLHQGTRAACLERLAPLLDESRRWETILSDSDRQSLALRAHAARTRLVIIIEAIDALETDAMPRSSTCSPRSHTHGVFTSAAPARTIVSSAHAHLIDDAQAKARLRASRTEGTASAT